MLQRESKISMHIGLASVDGLRRRLVFRQELGSRHVLHTIAMDGCDLSSRFFPNATCLFLFSRWPGSEPGEMAPKSSRAVVMPKFDMHTYTSNLTLQELKDAIVAYNIPKDLHPRLPPPGLTMYKLLSRYIGIYIEQLEQGGLRIPFSAFFLATIRHFGVHVSQLVPMGVNRVILFEIRCRSLDIPPTVSLFRVFYKLCKQGHWFSFKNKTEGRSRKCFKEVTSSLKGWKKKFFLIDRRAIPDAMAWRHSDTNVRDDFPNDYNEEHAERLATPVVLLRPPPRHVLYLCGTDIPEKCPAQKAVEKPNAKIVATQEKKDKLNAAKATTKRAGEEDSVAPCKKRVWKNQEVSNSGSKGTISITPLHQASPKHVEEGITSAPKTTAGTATGGINPAVLDKEVIDIGENTRPPTPPVITVTQPSLYIRTNSSTDGITFSDGGSSAEHQFVLEWGLRDDMRVSSVRACKEMIIHLATLAKDEFLGGLSNMDLVRRAYQCLGKNAEERWIDQTDFLLETVHSSCSDRERKLMDQLKEVEKERDDWRLTASGQVEKIKALEGEIEPNSKLLIDAEEKVHRLEKETHILEYQKSIAILVGPCYTAGWLGGLSLGKTEHQIVQVLLETKNLNVEGFETWKDKHRELFTKQ
nr:hypothetical protein [Tanacetum cinerariifolium]